MLYRAEIVVDGKTKASRNFPDNNPRTRVTQPRQAMNRIVKAMENSEKNVPERFALYVINEKGEVWAYSIKTKDSQYEATEVRTKNKFVGKDARGMIFSGNMSIHEAVM